MGAFTVKQGSDTFMLDTAGLVSADGQSAGTWTTNKQNQIVIARIDGTTVAFDATWTFNGQNQLTLQAAYGQDTAFNFASDNGIQNSFTTVNAVLQVKPDKAGSFQFSLRGDWSLDANHNLNVIIGGLQSMINGFVSDPIGRFIYHFANRQSPLQTSVLGFAGNWDVPRDANDQPVQSGDAILVFRYQKEDGTGAAFQLPRSATINRSTNQLAYTYKKDNKTVSINFQGTFMLDPNFQITYIFNRQVSSGGDQMVASTTIGFDARLTQADFTGDLQLSLTRPDGSAGTTLNIGGDFAGVLGKTKLLVGFNFQQTFGASGAITRTAAFNGDLSFTGGEMQWKFQATGQIVDLAFNVDVKLGPASVDSRLNIQLDHGQVSGVTFLLGVSF